MIIGISGKAGSGKNTVGDMLAYIIERKDDIDKLNYQEYLFYLDHFPIKYSISSFAFLLKSSLSELLNCFPSDLEDRDFKNNQIDWLNNISGRQLMQKFGDALRKEISDDFFIQCFFNKYHDCSNLIITDVRFKNEVDSIRNRQGIIIRINKELSNKDSHISETELDDYNEFDYYLDNNSTLEELFHNIIKMVKELCHIF